MKCPNCGKEIADDSKFCEHCGTKIRKSHKWGKGGLKFLWIPLVVILLGVIASLYFARDNKTNVKTTEIASATDPIYYTGDAKVDGEKFLQQNALREEVRVTYSGLQYEVLKLGKGAKPTAESTVKVHYEGMLIDGTVFDSSYQRGEPIEFPLNGVIRGWAEGVQLMPVGSVFKLYIPYELGYGDRAAGTAIPPYSTLIFTVELLSFK